MKHTITQSAFSLIELAIIITIFSVLMAGLLGGQTLNREVTRVQGDGVTMDVVQKSLQAFFQKNKYLPCPASLAQAPDTPAFGVSTDCALTAAPSGTTHVGVAADEYQIRIGAVPTRTLGIADRFAYDPWGNRLSYVILRRLGVDAAGYTAYVPTATAGYFQITDNAGAVTYGSSPTTLVAYALISYGADGKGATTKQGEAGLACQVTTPISKDSENCDADKQFTDAPVDEAQGTAYYYDFVRWVKKTTLDAL